jgi:hypothetical protein
MPSAAYDLEYLRAGLDVLEEYLLSKDIYWPLSASPPPGDPPYPRLTLGGLLLSRARARARELSGTLTPAQEADLTRMSEQLEATRSRWRVAWEGKASREFHARLNLWRDFLENTAKTRRKRRPLPHEVQRVMLQLFPPTRRGAACRGADVPGSGPAPARRHRPQRFHLGGRAGPGFSAGELLVSVQTVEEVGW